MKIVIAPDKFKGSLTGLEFCMAVKEGMHGVDPDVEIIGLPLADGGDGTIEVANHYLKGDFLEVEVQDPLFRPIKAHYLFAKTSQTAFIEMAEASGLKLLRPEELDCKNTSTVGTGALILDALQRGAKQIILGIGGSATNDCGLGMATALGYRFIDNTGDEVPPIGANLSKIVAIDDTNINPMLKQVQFKVACDVKNPLYGKNGAARIYAEQKGASKQDIQTLDLGLRDFSKVLDRHYGVNSQQIEGGGAAGGLGLGAYLFLNGQLISGIELVKELAQFDDQINGADWIISGEGKLDEQTLSGKTIAGVLKAAIKQNIPVAVLCGDISLSKQTLQKMGISYAASILDEASGIQDAMKNAGQYLKRLSAIFLEKLQKSDF